MSNRIFNMELALEKQVCCLHGAFSIGASGAVSNVTGIGIESITKESTDGQYTITLSDAYDTFLLHTGKFIMDGAGSGIVADEIITTPADLQSTFRTKSYKIQFYDTSFAAANAASGSTYHFEVTARRSSVGPTWSI